MSIAFISTLVSPAWRTSNLYRIKDKEKKTVVLRPNPLQVEILQSLREIRKSGRPVRLVILKPRQIGCTTFFGIRYLDRTMWKRNQFAAVVAHKIEKAHEIFNEIIKFSFDNLPQHYKFKAYNDSVNQLGWRQIASQIKVTSDGHGITPNLLHLTEVAHMRKPKEMISEALQGVPRSGEVIQESTANGKGGFFYDICEEARNDPDGYWRFLFLKWWKHPEYALPVSKNTVLTEYEKDLLIKFGIDGLRVENLMFRREKLKELLENRSDLETGLTGEMLFRQSYPMTPEEAFITSALSIFNVEILEWMRNNAPKPINKTQWGNGWFRAYEEMKPGEIYLISCDTSEGGNKSYSAACVFHRKTGRLVGILRGKYPSFDLAKYVLALGKYYNNALLVIERNMGHAVLNEAIHHDGYPNVYCHHDYDEHGRPSNKPGFNTSAKTRPIILSELERSIRDREIIPDLDIIEECLDFGYKDGKAQAIHGTDDCVLSYAIGNYLCKQPDSVIMPDGGFRKPMGM